MFVRAVAGILVVWCIVLIAVPAIACSISMEMRRNPAAVMVEHSERIAWAWAIKGENFSDEGVLFQVTEVLKGDVPPVFALPNSRYVTEETAPSHILDDAEGHREPSTGDLRVVGTPLRMNCTAEPHFIAGESYLIFLDGPAWAAYEMVRSESDLWLQAVREAINANVRR